MPDSYSLFWTDETCTGCTIAPPSPVSLFGRNCTDEDDFELLEEIKLFLADKPLENGLTAEAIALW